MLTVNYSELMINKDIADGATVFESNAAIEGLASSSFVLRPEAYGQFPRSQNKSPFTILPP
jgi:hypothetical protein